LQQKNGNIVQKIQLIDKSKKGIEITLWQDHHQKEQKILGHLI
jgi:hypothetical protein